MTFIKLTSDEGAAVHLRADRVSQVTELPARSPEALDKLIAGQQARLGLIESGFEAVEDSSFGCGPKPEQIQAEIATLERERSTGVRGSSVAIGKYGSAIVRESADEVIALIDATDERTTT